MRSHSINLIDPVVFCSIDAGLSFRSFYNRRLPRFNHINGIPRQVEKPFSQPFHRPATVFCNLWDLFR